MGWDGIGQGAVRVGMWGTVGAIPFCRRVISCDLLYVVGET